ncbi:MAG: cytochrome c oxidase subunit II [Gemmatimonadota bacterium]
MRRRTAARGLLPALLLLALVGCDASQYVTLSPASDFAEKILSLYANLWWWTLGIFLVVEALLIFALLRFRRKADDTGVPDQVHGHSALEISWTLLPAAILFFIAIPTVRTIFDTQAAPAAEANALEVTVIGHQWWWEFEYPALGFSVANELHLPRGRTVNLTLRSADVIHSFWIPRLGGKRDLNPGHENQMAFTPNSVGIFDGQCAEFCGMSHANMRMRVVVDEPAVFAAWSAARQTPAPADSAGLQTFLVSGCAACHAIAGTPAQGKVGPNLSGLGGRSTLAAGMLPNTPAHLAGWLRDPDSMKPGALMPDLNLNEARIDSLVTFLESLK